MAKNKMLRQSLTQLLVRQLFFNENIKDQLIFNEKKHYHRVKSLCQMFYFRIFFNFLFNVLFHSSFVRACLAHKARIKRFFIGRGNPYLSILVCCQTKILQISPFFLRKAKLFVVKIRANFCKPAKMARASYFVLQSSSPLHNSPQGDKNNIITYRDYL